MSEHAWVFESLTSYSSGGLEPAERERVEQHLAGCLTCTRALEEVRELDQTLENLFAEVRPEPGFENRVLEQLRPALRPRRFGFALRLTAAAAAVLFLGVVGAAMHGLAMDGRLPFPGLVQAPDADGRTIASNNLKQSALAEGSGEHNDSPSRVHTSLTGGVIGGKAAKWFVSTQPAPFQTQQFEPLGPRNGRLISGLSPDGTLDTHSITFRDQAGKPDGYFQPAGAKGGQPSFVGAGHELRRSGLDLSRGSPPGGEAPKNVPKDHEGEGRDGGRKLGGQAKGPEPAAPEAVRGRKIIRTGEIEFEIDSFDKSVETIEKLVKGITSAFIATINSEKLPNGKVRGSVVVRIPPDQLDTFLRGLRKNLGKDAELKSQRIGSQDVTKQYTDIESRLKAARTMEERLLTIIKTGKGEIKDLIAAERELGVWRTKIEEMEGEIRYYNNQISLSTLTITLEEKSIQSPSALVTTERVNLRIEVDDVKKSKDEALAAVEQHKGRVTKSELKQHPAGQLEATLVFEVEPKSALALRNALDKLGTVTQQDAEQTQQAEGGTGRPEEVKKRVKDVQYSVTLYNVANIQPRETFYLQLASNDVPSAFRKLKEAVAAGAGQVRLAQLNEQDKLNISAQLDFDVPRKQQQVMEKLLAEIGAAFSRSTSQAAIGETATDKKMGYRLKLLSVAGVPQREVVILEVEVADVRKAAAELANLARDRKGLVREDQFVRDPREGDTGSLVVDVPFSAKDELMQKFTSAGKVRRERSLPNPQVPEGALATARFNVTLKSGGPIVPSDEALWPKIRTSLFYSFTLLSWSLMFIILGLSVVLPWALIIYGVYRLVRRIRKKAEAAGSTA